MVKLYIEFLAVVILAIYLWFFIKNFFVSRANRYDSYKNKNECNNISFNANDFPNGKITAEKIHELIEKHRSFESYNAYLNAFQYKYLEQRYLDDYIRNNIINEVDDYLDIFALLLEYERPVENPKIIFDKIRITHLAIELNELGYLDILKRKYSQLVYKDDYGDIIYDDWNKELNSFLLKKFVSLNNCASSADDFYHAYQRWCGGRMLEYCAPNWTHDYPNKSILSWIDDIDGMRKDINDLVCDLSYVAQSQPNLFTTNDPIEYENFVSKHLINLGWKTSKTPATGDQGADVIANRNGVYMVIQCKLYSSPVGNKAIQEVYAAKGFYGAKLAAVVSNATYTKSAKQLASSLDVLLLHHDQLDEL